MLKQMYMAEEIVHPPRPGQVEFSRENGLPAMHFLHCEERGLGPGHDLRYLILAGAKPDEQPGDIDAASRGVQIDARWPVLKGDPISVCGVKSAIEERSSSEVPLQGLSKTILPF